MSTKKLQILGTSLGNNVYSQADEPINAPNGSLWIDLDEEAQSGSGSSAITDTTLTVEGVAADAKATGEALSALSDEKVNFTDIVNDLSTNVATKPLSAAQGVALKTMLNSALGAYITDIDAMVGGGA